MTFQIDPQMAALLAINAGGRILSSANRPGGTLGGALGAGLQGVPQELMVFHNAAAQKKMRELQMQQLQNELKQQAAIQQQRNQLATQYEQSRIPTAVKKQTPEGEVQVPGGYFDIPEQDRALAGALRTGDTTGYELLQGQQRSQLAGQQQAFDQQLELAKLGLQEEKQASDQQIAQARLGQRDYGAPVNIRNPQTGEIESFLYDKKTGDLKGIGGQVIPKNAFNLEVGPDGQLSFSQGGVGGFSKSKQSDLNEQQLNTSASVETVDRILRSTDDRFFTLGTRAGSIARDTLESLGIDSPDEFLAVRNNWLSGVKQNIAQMVKAMSGAQVTDKEREFILDFSGNPDKWINSGKTFRAKLIQTKYMFLRQQMRTQAALERGRADEFTQLDAQTQMGIRGDELTELFLSEGLSEQEAVQRARAQLQAEGYY
jgi:hypothetical protein